MSDGASFGIDLGVTGGDQAASAASALEALASKLTMAGTAATAASQAVKAGQAAYDQAETSANRAATALEKIGAAAEAQKAKLATLAQGVDGVVNVAAYQKAAAKMQELTARQAEMSTKSTAATAAMNAEAAALDKLKTAASAATDKETALSKSHDALKKKITDAEQATKDAADAQTKSVGTAGLLEGAFAKLGGPLGAVGQKASGAVGAFLKMGKSLGSAGPYVAVAVAVVAVAAAIAVVAAAAVVATVKIGLWAIGLADAARTQTLLSAGIARTVAGGRALDDTIDGLLGKLPTTREDLLALAAPLADSGLRGKELGDALETAATKAAQLKFGPDFAKQMLSLDSQSQRLKTGIAGIFGGLKIEGLLTELSKLVGLFDKSSDSGKAIKTVFESLFQPLIDAATAAIPKIISAIIGFEIEVLKALIAIKPWGSTILLVAEAIGILALIITAVMVAGLVLLLAAILILFAPIIAIVALFLYFKDTMAESQAATIAFADSIIDSIGGAIDYLTGTSLSQIGSDLIDGLVAGITAAGPKVLSAITGVATGAITAAKKALGIASPSTVFAEIGMHTAAGMEQGVDGGADAVQGSVEAMVAPPDAAAGSAGGGGAGSKTAGSGGGYVFNIVVNAAGGDGESIGEAVRAVISDLLTQVQGGTPSAAAG